MRKYKIHFDTLSACALHTHLAGKPINMPSVITDENKPREYIMLNDIGTSASQNVNLNKTYHANNNIMQMQGINPLQISRMDSVENSNESVTSYTVNPSISSENTHKSTACRAGWIAGLVVGITVLTGAGVLIAGNVRRVSDAEQPKNTVPTTKIPDLSLPGNSSTPYIHEQVYNAINIPKNNTIAQSNTTDPYSYYSTTYAPKQEKGNEIPNISKQPQDSKRHNNKRTLLISRDDFYNQIQKNKRYPEGKEIHLKLKEFYQNKIHDTLLSEVKNVDDNNDKKLTSLKRLMDSLNKYKEKDINIKKSHSNQTKLTMCHHQEEILARKKIELIIFAAEIMISNNKLITDVSFDSISGEFNRRKLSDEDIMRKEKYIHTRVDHLLKLNIKNHKVNMNYNPVIMPAYPAYDMENKWENIQCQS